MVLAHIAHLVAGRLRPAGSDAGAPLRFKGPYGIFAGSDGRIYVADKGNHRIVRVDDMNGTNRTTFP